VFLEVKFLVGVRVKKRNRELKTRKNKGRNEMKSDKEGAAESADPELKKAIINLQGQAVQTAEPEKQISPAEWFNARKAVCLADPDPGSSDFSGICFS
jgi:hypothetical protein